MTLKQVFDDLTDGILIVNDNADISYFNQGAASLISGDTVDTVGLPTTQRILRLILAGDIATPIRFVEKVDAREYQVKVIQMYSFYVVQFVEFKKPDDYQQIKSNAVRMIHDKLGDKLEKLSSNLESLKTCYRNADNLNLDALIQDTLHLSQNVQLSISEIHHLADLYLKRPVDTYSTIAPVKLLKSALAQVESRCLQKGIRVRIRKKRSSPVKFYCNIPWMKMAVTECLLKLIEVSERDAAILIRMDLHGHFLSIVIERVADGKFQDNDAEDIWIDHPVKSTSPKQAINPGVSFDLLLAERVVDLHGGTLKISDTADGQRFLIELPIGYESIHESTSAEEQLKIYAEDLAKLQARQHRLSAV